MSRIALFLTAAGLAVAYPPRLAAQAAPALGSVVRAYVRSPVGSPTGPITSQFPVEGEVIASDSTRLILVGEHGDTLTVPLVTIQQLYLRSDGSPPVLKGAFLGAVVGGLVGALIGHQTKVIDICTGTWCWRNGIEYETGDTMGTVTKAIAGSKTGAAIGAFAGLILGATARGYHWTRVGTNQVHLGVLPAGRGMRVGLSASF